MTGISGVSGGMAQVTAGASGRSHMGQKIADLFNQMDTNNTGSVTKAQFDSSFQSLNLPAHLKAQGAGAIFSKLDPHGTGAVSKRDFVAGMRSIAAKQSQELNQPAVAQAATVSSGVNALNSALGKNDHQQTEQQTAINLSIYA